MKKRITFTMPGRMGDALLQWPVAYQYAKQENCKIDLWMDERTCKPLVNLFKAQPCVSQVRLREGIKHYSIGGQPFDFGLTTADHQGRVVFHLGMRSFPQRQITLQTLEWMKFDLERAKLTEKSLEVGEIEQKNRLVLHGTFKTHVTGVPTFWVFLSDHLEELKSMFDEIVFVGSEAERARALEIYPDFSDFDDHGDLLETAKLMAGSRLVIGAGSSMVVLAGCLKIPSIRVHDPIGDVAKVVWNNLGENQLNDTERGLRKSWPKFKAKWLQESRVEVVSA